jgi:predicted dienelactone hydrolase
MSPVQKTYPIVFLRGGLAALVTQYTSLAEDLASHGYVVVGFDAPFRSLVTVFPDGRVIERTPENNVELVGDKRAVELATKLAKAWSDDISFALDEMQRLNASDPSRKFLGRLDVERVGVFGHSLGGATALQFCHDDGRCKAGIDVDGLPLGDVVRDGVTQPFMFLLSDHRSESDAESQLARANIRSTYDRLVPGRRFYVAIPDAGHYRFSDNGALLQAPLIQGLLQEAGVLKLDGRRQIAIAARRISTFFDVFLKGAPVSELSDS